MNNALLSVKYIKPDKQKEIEEAFEVITKDESGIKHLSYEPPLADIYFVEESKRNFNFNKPQERIENLNKVTCKISEIRFRIAEEIGEEGKQFIEDCYKRKDFSSMNRLFGWRYCFGCDFLPEFYFMKRFYENNKLGNIKLSKGFMDIETDIIDYTPDMEKLYNTAYSPVNVVTVILEESMEAYTFILKPYKPSKLLNEEDYNKRYQLYENQLNDYNDLINNKKEFLENLNNTFDSTYGKIKYNLREYEKEIDLIADVFKLINFKKPDFMAIWNMRFDIQYLIERIKVLNYDPVSIIAHPDFKYKYCSFRIDKTTYRIEKQFDYFHCSSYTQYICQLRLYGSIRKSQQMLKSLSLNAIADRELKDKKVEYEDETNMRLFPYKNYKKFIIYNIKDSLLQFGIERKTNDIMTYYMRSHVNLTPYSKIFRETHLLRNVRELYFEKEGWVQGNNLNAIKGDLDNVWNDVDEDDEDKESTYKGAIMANPIYNDKVGMKILGSKSNKIFKNTIDFDMGAFYPSCKISSNIDSSTLLFKALINSDDFLSGECSNKSLNQEYEEKDKNGNKRKLDFTGEVVHGFVNKNLLSFCYNYLNLPSITELYKEVKNKYSKS